MPRGTRKLEAVPFPLRLPRDLYDALKSAADRETRSMNGEIVHLLRERLCSPSDPWQSRMPVPSQQPSYPAPAPLTPNTLPPPTSP